MPRSFDYLLLDVFSSRPLAGNPLAVFLNAHGLRDAEMQALALELNLSETTFCFPQGEADREQGMRVRIFTTQEELPFAGHPTLGTATALRMTLPALHGCGEVRLRLNAGVVPVRFAPGTPPQIDFGEAVYGEMEQPLPVFGVTHDTAMVAGLLGVDPSDLDETQPVQTVSTGVAFAVVLLRTVEALGRMRLDAARAAKYLRGCDAKFFYVLAPLGRDGLRWRARMPFYGGEDPATGSAAGCAAACLVLRGLAPAGSRLRIEQGAETGRPSVLDTSATLRLPAEDSSATAWAAGSYVRVGGSTIPVAQGRFFLP